MTGILKTITLGCKVNQYETEYVREGLLRAGFRDAIAEERADLCVINTCTVTQEGDAKSRQIIRRAARENPAARIVVMGCYATRAPQEVARLPGVAEVITDKRDLPEWLGRHGLSETPDGISGFGRRHRAYVKVQDGCLLRCTYCIIPQVRPALTSRPVGAVADEVRRLLDNGFREIVLTGIHLGHFGVDWNWRKPKSEWVRLSHLVRELARIPGDFRIRLSSIEATEVNSELIAAIGEFGDKICPHLHICLQSGSDAVLMRMRRRWGVRRFVDCCRRVQESLDRPALTTDVLVGFPGETEDDFAKTCQVLRDLGFSKAHVFPFSPREGTPAATMDDRVPPSIISRRVKQLMSIEQELRMDYFRSLRGLRLKVLVESSLSPGLYIGTSCRYAPVQLSADRDLTGQLLDVTAGPVIDGRIAVDSRTEPHRFTSCQQIPD
jgi:threonylcarbamoyladenosine tRNA methylthiotransferase MtaB